MPAVEYRHVRMAYGDQVVVRDLDLTVPKGAFVTIVGSSGCGKTTILKMVNGLVRPTGGTVLVDGQDVSETDPVRLRRRIGYAIQGSVLFPHLTVEKNISFVPELTAPRDREGIRAAVRKWMGIVGLGEDLLGRYPQELSGGQQQRVGIARALAASPELLLMDEPFGAVDEITRASLRQEIARIHAETGITILFVTHDIGEALGLGDLVLVMDHGERIQYASPDEIRSAPADAFVERLLSRSL